jgi:hypothetical protein
MFASGLLRDRRDLQRQMRHDALCFAANKNGTIDARTVNKGSPGVEQPPPSEVGPIMRMAPEKSRSKLPPSE